MTIKSAKRALRKEILAQRDAQDVGERVQKSYAVMERLLEMPEFRGADKIFIYASYKSEVVTHDIITTALRMGKQVAVSKMGAGSKTMALYRIQSLEELTPNEIGIPEPEDNSLRRVRDDWPDLVIFPGAVFDTQGNRIGYGGGYYDKFISQVGKVPKVALAFELQIVEGVPHEGHDVPMDVIVTEAREIRP